MQGRTFFRIMIDNLFVNNAFCKAVVTLVNLCNNSVIYNKRKLKFLKNLPLYNKETNIDYSSRYIFNRSKVGEVKF